MNAKTFAYMIAAVVIGLLCPVGMAVGQEPSRLVPVSGSFLVERYQNDPYSMRVHGYSDYQPQPGDIWICSSKNKCKRCFFKLTTGDYCTHAVIVVRTSAGKLAVLSADLDTVRLYGVEEYLGLDCERIWVRQVVDPLSLEQSERLTKFAEAQVDKPYASFRRLAKIPFSTPIVSDIAEAIQLDKVCNGHEWFCSELVVCAARKAGLLSGHVCPIQTDPGDLFHLRCWTLYRPLEWSSALLFKGAPE